MSKSAYAYLAGIVDGEGCFSMSRVKKLKKKTGKGYYSGIAVHMNITNTSLPMMQFLQPLLSEIVGSPITLATAKRLTVTGKSVYILIISGAPRCLRITKKIYPYLQAKVQQADLMKEFCNRPKYSKITQREELMIKEMQTLNNRKRQSVTANTQVPLKTG